MKLILPRPGMEEAFKRMAEDYRVEEEWHYYYKYEEGLQNMENYLERLGEISRGIDLPEGDVATTTYWLVDEDETEIRGNIRIRHRAVPIHGNIGYDVPPSMRMRGYGREILKLGIAKAREMGIEDLRVTCGENNEASRRVIQGNGGRFLRSEEDHGENFLEYIIE
ncbi:acetyltransferase [Propionigenium maris DSM 9537]|uniref:Acetyltransferase n=1 Tax=Propionigenium maris DSM 9537 TaxID=1123000 RepID=A0A9W6GNI6_9FUSO|nr:GNAT family N-acetyltransferase [Propionigenium maris]GLI57026.1 acetyltransferase [Propionigenium maris DSM 9537]